MKVRNQNRAVLFVAATAAVAAMTGTHLKAAELYWQGGVGNIIDANYSDGTNNNLAYTPGDIVNLGGSGSSITVNTPINYSAATPNAPGIVRVGHNFGTLPGPATLTVAGSGATLVLVDNPAITNLFDRAALVVGYNADGSYVNTANSNMDGLVIIGADKPDDAVTGIGTGTVTVNGGNFRVRRTDLIIGYGNRGVLNHGAGNMLVGMHNTPSVAGAFNMYLGYTTASEWNKNFRGTCSIGNSLFIGSGSVVNLEAGVTTTKAKSGALEGDVVVGRNGSHNDRLNITFNGTPDDPVTAANTGLTELRIGRSLLLASGGSGATSSTVNHSEGTVTVALGLVVSDTGNTSNAVYNLSPSSRVFVPGSGLQDIKPSVLTVTSGLSRIGRRGDGKFIQTGGTATFNGGLAVGDDDSTAPGETDNATGLYEISGGTLTTSGGGDTLRLGSAGTGTLRVVGQGGSVTVNGNLTSSNTSDGAGKLAYKFESGESLSVVNVTGAATFAFNSGLAIDSSAIPTPASGTTYDLVSAPDVADNGLLLTDWGWTHQVVPGGAGELLQAVKTTPQYWDIDGTNPGAGGATPSGTWNGSAANFSTDATGSSATGATTGVQDDVVFAAGSDGTGSYTVTVGGTQTAHAVQFARGSVLLSGGTLAVGHFNADSGATGTVSSNITGDAFGRLIKSGAGTVTLASANSLAGGTTVLGGTLQLADTGSTNNVLNTGAVTIAPAARLDLTNNKLITTSPLGSESGGVYSGIQGEIQRAANFGAWDQPGLTTSMPDAAGGLTSIGAATGEQILGLGPTDTALFGGQTINGASTIAMYTYAGDANLDGFISGDDYAAIDFNIAVPGADGWYNGDFNWDGIISGDDYAAIDFNIVAQGAPFPTGAATALRGVSTVPEPNSLVLVSAAIAMGSQRRRRRARSTD